MSSAWTPSPIGGREFDPIDNRLRAYRTRKAGDPNLPRFFKEWSHRQAGDVLRVTQEEVQGVSMQAGAKSWRPRLGAVSLRPQEGQLPAAWVQRRQQCGFLHVHERTAFMAQLRAYHPA